MAFFGSKFWRAKHWAARFFQTVAGVTPPTIDQAAICVEAAAYRAFSATVNAGTAIDATPSAYTVIAAKVRTAPC